MNGDIRREEKWSKSIAVGSKDFIDSIKSSMGSLAQGRKRTEAGESYQLRELQIPYGEHFGVKKIEIEHGNTYLWR
ncbi:MAG: hypothetical protein R6X10_01840 [Desulfobacterales bacterium]